MGFVGASVPRSLAQRGQQDVIRLLRKKGATTVERSVPLADLSLTRSGTVDGLVRRGLIVERPDGRVYVNEGAVAEEMRRVLLIVLGVGVTAALAAAAAIWLVG